MNEKDILRNELAPYKNQIENSMKPCISVTAQRGKTSLWQSKFSGDPYFPKNQDYPKDSNGKPMKLLAQINFEELPDIGVFPNAGLIQFYISTDDDVYGLDFDDPLRQANFKVIYFSEVIKDEERLMNDFNFVAQAEYFPIEYELTLDFTIDSAPVSSTDYKFEKYFGSGTYTFFERFDEKESDVWDFYADEFSSIGHKIGGYAFFTQQDPRESGFEDYDILLLQIDSDDDNGILWGDCGVANFFIRKEDLIKRDFSKVLYNWDCH